MSKKRGIFDTFRDFETFEELHKSVFKFVGYIALGGVALGIIVIVLIEN